MYGSILDATCSEGPFKGFPLCAAIAIDKGEMTVVQAKQKMIAEAGRRKSETIAALDAWVATIKALPDADAEVRSALAGLLATLRVQVDSDMDRTISIPSIAEFWFAYDKAVQAIK